MGDGQLVFNIEEIIRDRSLVVYFQPIVSIVRKNLCGLEGLVRGVNRVTRETVPPLVLFDAAERLGLQIELDRACRDMSLQAFSAIYAHRRDTLLFLNLYSSILDRTTGSNYIRNTVQNYQINPNNIVIEINESRVQDADQLKRFVDTYRSYGFLIALDDVGCGFSNLDRIALVKPDIVKTDISLAQNICSDYYVKEVFRALVSLSMKIGALVVVEGIETECAALQALELGANMIQGYYISKPQPMATVPPDFLREKINVVSSRFQEAEKQKLRRNKARYCRMHSATREGIARLCLEPAENFDAGLFEIVNNYPDIECAYVLDGEGIQISGTVFSDATSNIKKNALFCPAQPGADHSMKDYYRHLKDAGVHKYCTDPYPSLATGNLCITFARTFQCRQKPQYILCVDFKV